MIHEVVDFLSSFVDAIMFFILFETFLKKREKLGRWVYGLATFVLAIFIFGCNSLFNFQWMNVLGMILSAFLLSFVYEGRMAMRGIVAIFGFSIGAAVEIIVLYLSTFVLHVSVQQMVFVPEYRLLGIIVSKITGLVVCHGIRVHTQLQKIASNKNYWLAFILLYLSYIIVIYWFFRSTYGQELKNDNIIALICAICLFLSMSFTVYLFEHVVRQSDELWKKEQYEQNLKAQLKHLDDLLAKQNEMRKFKHDISNQLIVLRGYLENDDVENGLKHVADLTQQVKKTEMTIHTGNTALDAILSTKKTLAESHGIVFQHVVRIQENLPLDPKDLCIIFGNALDNAIEACDRLPEECEKRISLTFLQDAHSLSCNIENTAAPNRPRTLATSKADKENHGFGVQNITETLAKYDSTPIITQSDNSFSLGFVIFLRR